MELKRKLTFVAFVAICLSLLSYGTFAFFTAVGTAHNVVTTGGVGIDLLEWADAAKTLSFPEGGVHDVMPGVEVVKIAEVKNIGEAAAYIRMRVRTTVTLPDGAPGDPAALSFDFNTENWTEKDGFYYYDRILPPGETTSPLFTTVTFDESMGGAYQNGTARVGLVACAVQSANNGESVFEAAGWPEIEEGSGES